MAVDADFIAIGTHGLGLLERVFVGSVASSVLHSELRRGGGHTLVLVGS